MTVTLTNPQGQTMRVSTSAPEAVVLKVRMQEHGVTVTFPLETSNTLTAILERSVAAHGEVQKSYSRLGDWMQR